MYEAGEDLLWNQVVVEFLELRFAGFTSIALPAFIVSYIFFFGIGGFLHVSAYIINYSRPPQVGIPGIPSFFLPKCFRKVVNFDLRFYIEGDYLLLLCLTSTMLWKNIRPALETILSVFYL